MKIKYLNFKWIFDNFKKLMSHLHANKNIAILINLFYQIAIKISLKIKYNSMVYLFKLQKNQCEISKL